ncbi:uncharacterized protein FMAN_12095 [Fusarium mangiferae]|uniref:Uncharacterized protein n=1 Tax=Fusarium mangiferae TaxID=192010 RepID=A0A1L7TRJ3_FUSMA|nr:uncharacterized protein FMAN_12095 [Fusarium mangiferae]CVK97917.1 uncharacterized protein FMAN_12095 [Fusarium mangiferae]
MDPQHIMCQCPNCNVEAKHWAPCTCPCPSSPDVSSSTHASPNSVSEYDQEPTTPSPATFEPHQSASALDQVVSFCYGGCSTQYNGFHPQMDYASPNPLIYAEHQDTQPGNHTPPTTPGQSSKSAASSQTEDHFATGDTNGIRSATEELEDLRPADRFLVKCRLKNMKWRRIHKQYNRIWEARSEGDLRARMSTIKDRNPAVRALLE